ncbi:MAG: pyrroline-5-carboxylate reductase [Christensenellales bacterium]
MKIGFLGAGAMGGAILCGALNQGSLKPEDVYVYDVNENVRSKFRNLGCNTTETAKELGTQADILLIAVKPQYAKNALAALENTVDGKTVISIMAGVTAERIRSMIEGDIRVLRVMPNTPALVCEGVVALCADNDLNPEEKVFAEAMFKSIGAVEWISENLIDSAAALSGSGPAYVAMFIEALADGGVMEGIPRAAAYRMAINTVIGSAKLLQKTEMHPGALKDMVCSPGGSTIVACKELEHGGFRAAVISAVQAAAKKNREL